MVPTTADPGIFTDNAPLITFPVPSGTASRPHMALPFDDEVFVADLVRRLHFNGVIINISPCFDTPPHSGCRQSLATS